METKERKPRTGGRKGHTKPARVSVLVDYLLDHTPEFTHVTTRGDLINRTATQVRLDGYPTIHRPGLAGTACGAHVAGALVILTTAPTTCHRQECAPPKGPNTWLWHNNPASGKALAA
jgi:hypothetical protein